MGNPFVAHLTVDPPRGAPRSYVSRGKGALGMEMLTFPEENAPPLRRPRFSPARSDMLIEFAQATLAWQTEPLIRSVARCGAAFTGACSSAIRIASDSICEARRASTADNCDACSARSDDRRQEHKARSAGALHSHREHLRTRRRSILGGCASGLAQYVLYADGWK